MKYNEMLMRLTSMRNSLAGNSLTFKEEVLLDLIEFQIDVIADHLKEDLLEEADEENVQ